MVFHMGIVFVGILFGEICGGEEQLEGDLA